MSSGRKSGPQAYYVPELDKVIKVEVINGSKYCVHYPDGPERVSHHVVHRYGWEHRGPWIEPVPHVVGE